MSVAELAALLVSPVFVATDLAKCWLPRRLRVTGERSVSVAVLCGLVLGVGGVALGFFPPLGWHDWRVGFVAGAAAALGAGGVHAARKARETRR